jgi:hypothetical protein
VEKSKNEADQTDTKPAADAGNSQGQTALKCVSLVLIGAIAAETTLYSASFCRPHEELCQVEPTVLADEPPEQLPRGPAPAPTQILVTSSTTASSWALTAFRWD